MPVEGRRRIAVTGGGTAGHILPALDFLDTYCREFGAQGYFIGCAAGMESRLVPARGVRLEIIHGLPIARQDWHDKVRAGACLPSAIRAARRILLREKTELVIGAGGYASFSACVAAYTLGLPVVIHESNVEPGMTNRFLGRIAALICVGCEEAAAHFRGPVRVTGVPYGNVAQSPRPGAPPWRMLVLGGSEGSPLLNREAPLVAEELRRRGVVLAVRHLAGAGDLQAIARAYTESGIDAQVYGFVDDVAPLYEWASFAVASAGARTVAELSAAGIPALLVPLPGAARNHQRANARVYAARCGTLDERWDWRSAAAYIEKVVAHTDEFERRAHRAAEYATPDAAREVVRACEDLMAAKAGRQRAEGYTGADGQSSCLPARSD